MVKEQELVDLNVERIGLETTVKELKHDFERWFDELKQKYQKVEDDFEDMKRQIRDWEKEKERISQIQQISEIVKLNVGGHKDIDVRKSTLTQVKGSALEAMFSGRHQLQTVDGRVFIDRDPGTFKMVIEFIRNQGNMSEIQANNCKGFLNELNYWGMDPKYFEVDRSDIKIAQECFDKCNLRGILKEKNDNEFI